MDASMVRPRIQSELLSCTLTCVKVSITNATLFALDLTAVGAAGTPNLAKAITHTYYTVWGTFNSSSNTGHLQIKN